MKSSRQNWLYIVFGIGLLFAVVFFALRPPQIPRFMNKSYKPDFFFEDVTISLLSDGKESWTIHSVSAEIDKRKQLAQLKGIQGQFLNRSEKTEARFSSPSGFLTLHSHLLTLNSPHVVFYFEGAPVILKADVIHWSDDNALLKGTGHVELASEQMTIYGNTFFSNPLKKTLVVTDKAYAIVRSKEVP